jgi:hypothetical protein
MYVLQMMKVVIKTNEITDDPFLNMVIMHESLHTLGLGHTTRRKDRSDSFTSVSGGIVTFVGGFGYILILT